MKLIISLFLILILTSFNVNAVDTNQSIQSVEKKLKSVKPLLSDKSKIDLDKILKERSKFKKTNQNSFNFQKLKPFIFLGIILIGIAGALRNESQEEENKVEKKKSKNTNQSQIDEFIKKSNEKEKTRKTNKDKDKEEYESNNLKIKIEERIHENNPVYFVMAIGAINIKDLKSIKKDNGEAKFTVYAFDITDKENHVPLQCNTDPFKDDNYLLSSNRNMKAGYGYEYFEWTPMFIFPKSLIVPPYRGERKIKFVINSTKIDAKFEQGKIIEGKTKKDKKLYFEIETLLNLKFEEPGFLETGKFEDDVNNTIVQLGMAIAYSEKKMNQKGLDAIKEWINNEIIWKYSFLDLDNDEEKNEKKIKYSFLLKNTYQLLKKNKLSMSQVVKELNYKSNVSRRYDAMNLLLNIAGADDRLSTEEDKLLNKTARALKLDLNRFQQMKTSTIANIETIDETSEENEDTIFNFALNMTDAEKCKKLRQEYTRWNRQTNNSNEKIRNQAKKMVELAAKLRKKYNC